LDACPCSGYTAPSVNRLASILALLLLATSAHARAQDLTPPEAVPEEAPVEAPPVAPTETVAPDSSAPEAPASDVARYLVRPLGGDASAEASAEACDAVRATLAAEGFGVIEDADVAAQIAPARLDAVHRLDDLRPIATELGANAVATVAVWTSDGLPDSVTVSLASGARSFSASETLAGRSLGEGARDAVRGALTRQRNALLVSGGDAGPSIAVSDGLEPGPDVETGPPPPSGPTLFGIIGPGFIAALGASGVGLGVYASLDGYCRARGVSGRCLIGEDPNIGLGVLLIVGGVVAIAGAIVWWVTGAGDPAPAPRIDVAFLPEGGATVTTNGTF
jgi:hypothetical protein